MKTNWDNFSEEDIRKFAASDVGQELMSMLQGSTIADTVRSSAEHGKIEDAQKALRSFLANPKAQAILRRLEEQGNG